MTRSQAKPYFYLHPTCFSLEAWYLCAQGEGQSQGKSTCVPAGGSPLEGQDGEKPKVTIVWRTNVTCPQSFCCVFSYLREAMRAQAATVLPAFPMKEGSPAGRFMTCSRESKGLPETAKSCCLWLQAQVSEGFH